MSRQEFSELTAANYHINTDYIGRSGLDLVARSPKHYWQKYLSPDAGEEKKTPALLFGALVHSVVLEPMAFAQRYEVIPHDMNKRTSEWLAFQAEHLTKQLIDVSDYERAMSIRAAIFAHPDAARLLTLEHGIAEKPMWAKDPVTGVLVKSKPDFHNTNLGALIDVKTTTDASYERFARDAFNLRYHVQDAFYTDVAAWAGTPVRAFAFIAVEKEPPYEVAVYVLDDDSRELGRAAYRENLNTYSACLKSGIWHGYDRDIKPMRLPAWAFH
jgi:hypothetical protein